MPQLLAPLDAVVPAGGAGMRLGHRPRSCSLILLKHLATWPVPDLSI